MPHTKPKKKVLERAAIRVSKEAAKESDATKTGAPPQPQVTSTTAVSPTVRRLPPGKTMADICRSAAGMVEVLNTEVDTSSFAFVAGGRRHSGAPNPTSMPPASTALEEYHNTTSFLMHPAPVGRNVWGKQGGKNFAAATTAANQENSTSTSFNNLGNSNRSGGGQSLPSLESLLSHRTRRGSKEILWGGKTAACTPPSSSGTGTVNVSSETHNTSRVSTLSSGEFHSEVSVPPYTHSTARYPYGRLNNSHHHHGNPQQQQHYYQQEEGFSGALPQYGQYENPPFASYQQQQQQPPFYEESHYVHPAAPIHDVDHSDDWELHQQQWDFGPVWMEATGMWRREPYGIPIFPAPDSVPSHGATTAEWVEYQRQTEAEAAYQWQWECFQQQELGEEEGDYHQYWNRTEEDEYEEIPTAVAQGNDRYWTREEEVQEDQAQQQNEEITRHGRGMGATQEDPHTTSPSPLEAAFFAPVLVDSTPICATQLQDSLSLAGEADDAEPTTRPTTPRRGGEEATEAELGLGSVPATPLPLGATPNSAQATPQPRLLVTPPTVQRHSRSFLAAATLPTPPHPIFEVDAVAPRKRSGGWRNKLKAVKKRENAKPVSTRCQKK